MERYYWIYDDGITQLAKKGEDYEVVTADNIEELREDFDNMSVDYTNTFDVLPLQEGDLIVEDQYVYHPKLNNLLVHDSPMCDMAFGTFDECLLSLLDWLNRCETTEEQNQVTLQICSLVKLELDAVRNEDID